MSVPAVREDASGRVVIDASHRESAGCSRCGSVRALTRVVLDAQLSIASATACALCGQVLRVIEDGLPAQVPGADLRAAWSRPVWAVPA